jgi:hypothetical protein
MGLFFAVEGSVQMLAFLGYVYPVFGGLTWQN